MQRSLFVQSRRRWSRAPRSSCGRKKYASSSSQIFRVTRRAYTGIDCFCHEHEIMVHGDEKLGTRPPAVDPVRRHTAAEPETMRWYLTRTIERRYSLFLLGIRYEIDKIRWEEKKWWEEIHNIMYRSQRCVLFQIMYNNDWVVWRLGSGWFIVSWMN